MRRIAIAFVSSAWLFACSGDEKKGNSADAGNAGVADSSTDGPGAGGSGAGGSNAAGANSGGSNAAGAAGKNSTAGQSNAAGSGNGGSGNAGSGNGGSGNAGSGAGGQMVPAGLLDPARTTTWNPGILADTQSKKALGPDGLPVRAQVCARPAPGDDLNAAIAQCPEGQVVELAAGTYTTSSVVILTKGVVLRGAGSAGAAKGGTTISRTGGGSVLAIGSTQDGACYASAYDTYALTADATKETTVVHVGANASHFNTGDLALLDEVDDATVDEGDCQYFKRVDKRSVSERVEVASVDTTQGTVTLSTPLHFTFHSGGASSGQLSRVKGPIVRWAGIESLAVQGGTNPGYDGQMAGGIDVSNAAYCWIKDVQTDSTIGGMHVSMTGAYRCVVRDSHFHNSANYGFGADCYGIVLRCGAADNLVENNIVRYMNKPILFNVSGGGNVIGYNYADNSWATPAEWQEVNIDTHCAFPHMELMEGNYAPHMGATITHGNAGYLTYFRNYSSSQFASPPVAATSTGQQTGNIAALQFDHGDVNMTVIGNVLGSSKANDLGTAPVSSVYIGTAPGSPSIFEIGDNANHDGTGKSDVAYTTLWSHANYDTVTPGVVYNPSIATQTLPSSLYLSAKPAWWPAGKAWPWAGSDLNPMVGTLPAKARSDTLGP